MKDRKLVNNDLTPKRGNTVSPFKLSKSEPYLVAKTKGIRDRDGFEDHFLLYTYNYIIESELSHTTTILLNANFYT